MEVIHIPSGPVCQNHSTTVPRRLAWKIKHAIQFTIFNWNFNYNLFNTNREGNERTESATGEFLYADRYIPSADCAPCFLLLCTQERLVPSAMEELRLTLN